MERRLPKKKTRPICTASAPRKNGRTSRGGRPSQNLLEFRRRPWLCRRTSRNPWSWPLVLMWTGLPWSQNRMMRAPRRRAASRWRRRTVIWAYQSINNGAINFQGDTRRNGRGGPPTRVVWLALTLGNDPGDGTPTRSRTCQRRPSLNRLFLGDALRRPRPVPGLGSTLRTGWTRPRAAVLSIAERLYRRRASRRAVAASTACRSILG